MSSGGFRARGGRPAFTLIELLGGDRPPPMPKPNPEFGKGFGFLPGRSRARGYFAAGAGLVARGPFPNPARMERFSHP